MSGHQVRNGKNVRLLWPICGKLRRKELVSLSRTTLAGDALLLQCYCSTAKTIFEDAVKPGRNQLSKIRCTRSFLFKLYEQNHNQKNIFCRYGVVTGIYLSKNWPLTSNGYRVGWKDAILWLNWQRIWAAARTLLENNQSPQHIMAPLWRCSQLCTEIRCEQRMSAGGRFRLRFVCRLVKHAPSLCDDGVMRLDFRFYKVTRFKRERGQIGLALSTQTIWLSLKCMGLK